MSNPSYPTTCLSAYCGRILCDGCAYRPALAAWYERRGDLAKYEERQAAIRAEKAAGGVA